MELYRRASVNDKFELAPIQCKTYKQEPGFEYKYFENSDWAEIGSYYNYEARAIFDQVAK